MLLKNRGRTGRVGSGRVSGDQVRRVKVWVGNEKTRQDKIRHKQKLTVCERSGGCYGVVWRQIYGMRLYKGNEVRRSGGRIG